MMTATEIICLSLIIDVVCIAWAVYIAKRKDGD